MRQYLISSRGRIAFSMYELRHSQHGAMGCGANAPAVTVAEQVAEKAAAAWLAAWPGGDLDVKDEAGWSALQRAAEAGQAPAVAELLRRPASR